MDRLLLRIDGLVDTPTELSLRADLGAPKSEQITAHYCIQGWSGDRGVGGAWMSEILDIVKPRPEAKWVVFYSFAAGPEGGCTTTAIPSQICGTNTRSLAYEMNGEPLNESHGAPLRLRDD